MVISPELTTFNDLYQNINGMQISLSERERLHREESSFIYGEIIPEAFTELLTTIKPQANDVFYDLGAGSGKAVFAAALFFNWKKCCGVELLPGLHTCSQMLLDKFVQSSAVKQCFPNKLFNIEFIQADMLQADFSDATVIYLHATTFDPALWEALKAKLNQLPKGVRLITVTKQLDDEHFEKITDRTLLMTWGESSAFVYRRR